MAHPIGHNGGPPVVETGWVAISRSIIEHHIVGAGQPVDAADKNKGSFSRLESWLDLLTLANWAERKVDNRGVSIILQPGQTLAGRAFLAERWNWSEKTVRNWLTRLERELMITLFCEGAKEELKKHGQLRGHTRNVISICNWSKYQGIEVVQGPDPGPVRGQSGASQGPQKNKGTIKQDIISPNGEMSADADVPVSDPNSNPRELRALEAFEAYNALAQRIGLKSCGMLTPGRRKALMARLREYGGADAWQTALANIERSAFLRGQVKDFQANFDWIIKAANFGKVVDGTYGNGAHADAGASPRETMAERYERMAKELAEETAR